MSSTQLNLLIAAGQLLFALLVFLRIDVTIFHRKPKRGIKDVTTPGRGFTRDKLVLILIVGGFAFSGYAFYRTLKHPEANVTGSAALGRKQIAEALAAHLQDGLNILRQYDKPPYPKQTDLNDWEENVHRFLKSNALGQPYVARFDSASGFEGVYPVELPPEDVSRYVWLEQRIAALREFIKEFSQQ